MMNTMKLGVVLLASLCPVGAWATSHPELGRIQTVYLLSMSNGFDQYLANQLTMQDVFEVVTDPQKADAVFVDQIGLRFEKQLEDLYPPPPPPEEPVAEEEEQEGEEVKEEPEAEASEDELKEEPVRFSSFGRGRGNLFLVGRESRRVVWSTYDRPKDFRPKELNRTAKRIVEGLKKTLTGN
jgi:hypothetical protein